MVAGSIEQRIKKMKDAILTEAKQRAIAIVENASEEADQERAKIYNFQKERIDNEFSYSAKLEKVKAKIQKSSLINHQRIKKMQVRYELVEKLKGDVIKRLSEIIKNTDRYKGLIKSFIVQGMLKMMERNIGIETRKEHNSLVTSLFGECQKQFTQILLKATEKEMESKLAISEYSLEESHKNIIGGVFLRSSDGMIVCDNSLDSRIRLIFEQLLPTIRMELFGVRDQLAKPTLI